MSREAAPEQGGAKLPDTGASAQAEVQQNVEKSTAQQNVKNEQSKELVLNGKGGFGTPPKRQPKQRKHNTDVLDADTPPKRGRPKKKFIVVINYEPDLVAESSIGSRIDGILAGTWQHIYVRTPKPPPATSTYKPAVNPSKPVHSFFSAKPAPRKDESSTRPTTRAMTQVPSTIRFGTTPRKSRPPQIMEPLEDMEWEQDQRARQSRQVRSGGAIDAPWPGPGWNRIEPVASETALLATSPTWTKTFRRRGHKNKPVQIRPEEDVVLLAQTAHVSHLSTAHPSSSTLPNRTLPVRTVETGSSLLSKISTVLSTKFASHAAISSLKRNMGSSMSAFDLGTSDTQTWCEKYAPKLADQVLQTGKEPVILRQWLEGLTINTVEKAPTVDSSRRKPVPKPVKKRPRKTHGDMDDFLVDSDEEPEDELRALSDEDDLLDSAQRTIVRNGGLSTDTSRATQRLTNAVLLSGPHGCGKSATAYAVAKELGFEVFEINAGSRRSGKDIIDKVGDMASNHQVRKGVFGAIARPVPVTVDTTDEHREASPPPDMTKQKSLNSFFTATAPALKTKPQPSVAKKRSAVGKQATPVQSALSLIKQAVKQRQSLILFEEVDVLFDDDKLFWESLLDLAVQSKRPIIMTCTDENLVPLNALSLHGILRLRRPPVDLAVDYLLLMAANEGHRLRRQVVENLYNEKHQDLRASVAQLSFFCQMGIGDERGGLNWYLPRWPPGIDEDPSGNKLRVVSTDSCTDMTQTPFKLSSSESSYPRVEEFTERRIDSGSMAIQALDSWALRHTEQQNVSEILGQYCKNMDLLSSIDVFAPTNDAQHMGILHDQLDNTMPLMTDKSKHSFTVGYSLLQADLDSDERQMSSSLALAAHLNFLDGLQGVTLPLSKTDHTAFGVTAWQLRQHIERHHLHRADFAAAFDPISNCESSSDGLTASCFDGTFKTIVEDLAPFVRSIAAYDLDLEQRRARLDALLGGRANKRQRTTRAARSAFEGGQRATTRKERWFPKQINYEQVMKTAGQDWPRPNLQSLSFAELDLDTSSQASTEPTAASQ